MKVLKKMMNFCSIGLVATAFTACSSEEEPGDVGGNSGAADLAAPGDSDFCADKSMGECQTLEAFHVCAWKVSSVFDTERGVNETYCGIFTEGTSLNCYGDLDYYTQSVEGICEEDVVGCRLGESYCEPDPEFPAELKLPGQDCMVDADCGAVDTNAGVCVRRTGAAASDPGICMLRGNPAELNSDAAGTLSCYEAGSEVGCPRGTRCFDGGGSADRVIDAVGAICYPMCRVYSCDAECDWDADLKISFCIDEDNGMGDLIPGSTCRTDDECHGYVDQLGVCERPADDPAAETGICMIRASNDICYTDRQLGCPDGMGCWMRDSGTANERAVCFPRCDTFRCDATCDSDDICAP